jgi:hypothetical protein
MSFLPSDLLSFVWGAALGGLAAFATGFLKEAGKHAFSYSMNKLNPKPPEPIQLDGKFVPSRFEPGMCAWVNEAKLYEYEQKNYTYYPHPKDNARCFRITSDGQLPVREFLLVQPGSAERKGA